MWTKAKTDEYRSFKDSPANKSFFDNIQPLLDIAYVLSSIVDKYKDIKYKIRSYHSSIQDPNNADIASYIPNQRELIKTLRDGNIPEIEEELLLLTDI